tara:strand:+ start:298 stop:528 length:231 start_codon:yes stop_codon:yes gene_type:complete
MKPLIIMLTLLLTGCGGCNLSKGDNVKRLSDGSIGKVLFIYTTAAGVDTCTARIIHDGLMGQVIGEYYGADWVVVK